MKQPAAFDSSFWINAHRSGLLPDVLARYALHYSPTVAAELSPSFPSGQEFWRQVKAGNLVQEAAAHGPVQEFGPGERSAINLALQHRNWVLLLDDYRPFQEAVRRGLRVLCSPVLAVMLFDEGELDARGVLETLARLAALQTVSPHLLAAALVQVSRILKPQGAT